MLSLLIGIASFAGTIELPRSSVPKCVVEKPTAVSESFAGMPGDLTFVNCKLSDVKHPLAPRG